MTEARLQQQVIDLARWAGWIYMHIRDSRKSSGVGFPDLVLVHVRTGRLVFAELKSENGKPTLEQTMWLGALVLGGHEVYLWRPADWESGAIRDVLTRAEEVAA